MYYLCIYVHCYLYDYQYLIRQKTKVAIFCRVRKFFSVKVVQYCFALAQSNSHKIMVFVGQKQQKFFGVTKTFERDVIFTKLHVILQSLIQVYFE